LAHEVAIKHPLGENACVIIGAGIAGLTAALALEQFGFSVLILEKAESLEEVGAGLQLSPNSTSVLAKLNVLDGLVRSATNLRSIDLMSARGGRPLLSLNTAPLSRPSAPFLSVHRADLQYALLAQVLLRPSIVFQLGASLVSYQVQASCVEIEYQVGNTAHIANGHCLIGADGVNSALRQSKGGAKVDFSGYVALRQTIDRDKLTATLLLDNHTVKAFVAPNAHLVAYPISNGKQVNLVFIHRPKSLDAAKGKLALASALLGFAPQLAQNLAQYTDWSAWPVYTLETNTSWQLDARTILIGDAAHAILPFAAQGAGMAIEDAYTLAYCLAQSRGDVSSGLSNYETLRRKRVTQVAARSKLNAFAYHASGPVALARNLVFNAKGQRLMSDLAWLYAYRAPGIS
jgi:salicylate hydroxylase